MVNELQIFGTSGRRAMIIQDVHPKAVKRRNTGQCWNPLQNIAPCAPQERQLLERSMRDAGPHVTLCYGLELRVCVSKSRVK